ncbi:probable serine/threonine-protein kinase DDB_G0272282 isoform X2 [Eupeodes corollae]|uniref:probable serine/threonine-protein kinase DDB_G0272282 isoform X2 n=1 Tax=Eupeodes corollae TaxID=290404 RepID=UPI002493C626|nr:probable serine/threonine-protein kinase DDB_G0272282 isoform X2 [Eupeodes corollae]
MTWYLLLVSLTFLGLSNAVVTKRSNRNQNFQHYEIQTFGISSPVGNIIDAISAPLNILADRLTRQPGGGQQFNPGFVTPQRKGPPGHFGPPGHHHHNQGPHGQQQNNPFHYPPPPQPQQQQNQQLPPYLTNLPSREQFNRPGTQFPQGQFPQNPNFFPFGQNYPKPGFANNAGNTNGNTNNNNRDNPGCFGGFCRPSQSQRPNQFGNNGFGGNNFGVSPNSAQNQNDFGTPNMPSQENGLVQSTFGGFGTTGGSQRPQLQPGNQFGNGGFNNNNFGVPPNMPQTNNNFGTPNRPTQENGLVQSTFGGFGTDGSQRPQSQPENQFGNGGFNNNNNNFGDSTNRPQSNNGFGTPNAPSQDSGLIQTTFGGFGPNDNQTPQSNNAPATQNVTPGNDDLIGSIFGKQPDAGSSTQTQTQPQSNSNDTGDLISTVFAGFPVNPQPNTQPQTQPQFNTNDSGNLISTVFAGFPVGPQTNNQPQTQPQPNSNDSGDLISGIFAGFPANPQTNNNGNAASQISTPSDGNDLIQGVFPGFGTSATPLNTGNNLQTSTEMSADAKTNNDLIESIFSGTNNNNGQNVPDTGNFATSTVPPSTTNSNGLIYDIDVRISE